MRVELTCTMPVEAHLIWKSLTRWQRFRALVGFCLNRNRFRVI